jgi:hypothetical protein
MSFLRRKGAGKDGQDAAEGAGAAGGKGKPAAKDAAKAKPAAGVGVPEWAAFMGPDEYAEFRRLTDDWLRGHVDEFHEMEEGALELSAGAGGPMMVGLTDLAQKCHLVQRAEWATLIEERLGGTIARASSVSLQQLKFEDVQSVLKVRIYPEDYAPPDRGQMLISRPVAPGMQAAVAVDFPETVVTVHPDYLTQWGQSADELFELGLANVRAQDVPDEDVIGDTSVHLLSGDSFFVATRILMLEEHLKPTPEYGALVIVPNRHAVLFRPIEDASIVEAVGLLLGVADAQFRQGPGSISSSLYWWKDGRLTLLPSEMKEREIHFSPPDEFIEMLNVLARGG